MPYTPPSARSPAGSRPNTPRSNSFSQQEQQHINHAVSTSPKKDLPHSSTSKAYLTKHRRSPPVSGSSGFQIGAFHGSTDTGVVDGDSTHCPKTNGIVDPHSKKPAGPENVQDSSNGSPASSSDEEPSQTRGRLRDVANLAELQAAIRIIEQHREGSPTEDSALATKEARSTLGLPGPRIHKAVEAKDLPGKKNSLRPALTDSARKISHSRSSTDASAFLDFPRNKFESPLNSASVSDVEDDDEEDLKEKPILIRKKSGELVRPALRASSTRRRPSSMPGTPTYAKAVHFQESSLEHVRHFLQVDRPIAVSAGSSPVETYDDDMDFPFPDSKPINPPYDWEIKLANFPQHQLDRTTAPVKVEKVYLSTDTKVLIGSVAVRNISFHKFVVARFTLDYWKTTSEVVAEYNNDVRKKYASDGYDRFNFNIKLEDQANLEQKSMFFCVRYNVNGAEYWDNNGSLNYQVDFAKKYKFQNGKGGRQSNGLPRSKPSNDFSPKLRPRSMPSFDDFATAAGPYDFSTFPHPSSMVGESPIRFRKQVSGSFVPDGPPKTKSSANQQAFGNRYDFGASLSAAISAASNQLGDRSPPMEEAGSDNGSTGQPKPSSVTATKEPSENTRAPGVPDTVKPSALTSEKPSVQSTSYNELLDKYCFVRSRQGKEKGVRQLTGVSS